jgi:hypothetical protein
VSGSGWERTEEDAMDSSSRPSKGDYVLTEQRQGAEPTLSLVRVTPVLCKFII